MFETWISVWNWSEESYHISLISKLGVPLGSHNTEPNWWNYTQRNCFWFVQFSSWWKWTTQKWEVIHPKVGYPSKVDDSLCLIQLRQSQWDLKWDLNFSIDQFYQSTFCYNLGKLIKKNTYGFLFVSWKLPGWDEMQSFILSYQFQSQKHKSPNSFFVNSMTFDPGSIIFPEIKLEERSFWFEFQILNQNDYLSKIPNFVQCSGFLVW